VRGKFSKPILYGNVAILLLTLLAYLPVLGGGFIWDDDAYVTNNPMLTAPGGWQRIWFSAERQTQFFPLVFSTLRLEHALWGLNPLGYHLVNVLMHAANTMLLWAVLRRLVVPGAWIAAALFAFHPVQVESVAWVTELKNTQSVLFCLLALLTWMRFLRCCPVAVEHKSSQSANSGCTGAPRVATTRASAFYLLTLAFYLLALSSKTTACTLPAALLLVPWMQGQRIWVRRVLQVVPFLVLGVVAGLVSVWWESYLGNYQEDVGQSLTLVQRTLIAAHALWFYAGKLVWPVNLTFSYPRWQVNVGDPANCVWLAGCLAVAFALWFWRKAVGRRVIGAVIFFAATLSPLLGFIPLYTFRFSYVADHYQYEASIGLLALAGAGLCRIPRVFPVALLAALGLLTWKQAHIYRDQTALWRDTLAKNPASWIACNNLGLDLYKHGHVDEAITLHRRSVELNPNDYVAPANLGIELAAEGKFDEAIGYYRMALKLHPEDRASIQNNLGVALFKRGNAEAAIKEYQQVLQEKPDRFDTWYNLGDALVALNRLDDAERCFRQALRIRPDFAIALYDLGNVLADRGRYDDAIACYKSALHSKEDFFDADFNLAATLVEIGKADDATPYIDAAIRMPTADPEAHFNLGRLLLRLGRHDDALAQMRIAWRLKPDYVEAAEAVRALERTQNESP